MSAFRILLVTLLVNVNFVAYSQDASKKEIQLEIDTKSNCQLRYFYYPNLQAYFDNLNNVFHYQENGKWHTEIELPKFYGGYSLYKLMYVVINDYDDEKPFLNIQVHKKLYPYNYKGSKMKISD